MDHLINKFEGYIEFDFNEFYSEWKSGKYKKFSECPTYHSLSTVIKSVNVLNEYMGLETVSISKMISHRD